MFKNVATLIKFKSQLLERKREAKREAKKKAKEAAASANDATATLYARPDERDEPPEMSECQKYDLELETQVTCGGGAGAIASAARDSKGSNFIVKRSRKQLASMAERLRRVKSFSVIRGRQRDSDFDKPKFVIDYAEARLAAGCRESGYDSDTEDDAYVSASESLYDDDDNGHGHGHGHGHGDQDRERAFGNTSRLPVGVQQAHRAVASYTSDQVKDEKFILPEEQCDIPTFLHTRDCDRELIDETRRLLRERYEKNPSSFYEEDYQRMLADDWTVSRFLLRRRLDPKRTAALMENCGKFRRQYQMGRVEPWEFPAECHLAGGLFQYASDRAGNTTMYMRIKMYRRVPEITELFKSLVLSVLEQCDVSTNGRGTAVVFDLSECGLQNVDLGFLYWLLNSFRNYCPKGVSYILVLNLPWFLSATAKLAMTWMSATNKRSLRFVQGSEIEDFIAPENLPDYLNGTCKQDYRRLPASSQFAATLKMGPNLGELSREQAAKIRELFRPWVSAGRSQGAAHSQSVAEGKPTGGHNDETPALCSSLANGQFTAL